jgi:hypothetical protein
MRQVGHTRVLGFVSLQSSVAVLVTAIALGAVPAVLGDVFHLRSGGSVSGQVLRSDADHYEIRTAIGDVRLPTEDVDWVEVAPSPFDDYELRRQQTPDTPAGQYELAAWCAEQELTVRCGEHLKRALELAPDYEPVRQALVDARTVVEARTPAAAQQAADEEAERLTRAIRGQWFRRIRTIQESYLRDLREERAKEGRDRILAIRDPLAVGPLAEVLTGGPVSDRRLLVQVLTAFRTDEATMTLALLALVDPDSDIRREAVGEVTTRGDARVVTRYREALQTGNDLLIKRAAYGLGVLGAKEAVPNLIDLLLVDRTMMTEVPVRAYFELWGPLWNNQPRATVNAMGSTRVFPGRSWDGRVWYVSEHIINAWMERPVTVYRTEVLEALRTLTGQDYGFDQAQWRAWNVRNSGQTP